MLVGLKANMDSGDEGRSDGDLNTFNALDPRFAEFGGTGLIGPTKGMNLHPSLTLATALGRVSGIGALLHRKLAGGDRSGGGCG